MSGFLLHVGALTNCPHPAGVVTVTPLKPPRVFVDGTKAVIGIGDLHKIAGCLLTVGAKSQPCFGVELEPCTHVTVDGQAAVMLTEKALCKSVENIPQGPPVASTVQTRVVAS